MSTNSSLQIVPQTTSILLIYWKELFCFRKYRIAFMIAILVGIAIGCIKYYSSGKMYKSRLILHSSFLTNLEEIEIINPWMSY